MWLNSSCVECDTRSVYSTSHSYWHVDRYASAPPRHSHPLGLGEQAVAARLQLQPVAAHDLVVHHEAHHERQLRLEDVVQVHVVRREGRGRRRRLAQRLGLRGGAVVLELGGDGALLGMSARGR